MSCDSITFTANSRRINERSILAVTARFRNLASAADVTPTNVKYRLDDLGTGWPITDWTTVTPGTTATITLSAAENAIRNCTRDTERKQLVVASDYGLSTQFLAVFEYDVRNLQGVTS